jgi:hypothetical protein
MKKVIDLLEKMLAQEKEIERTGSVAMASGSRVIDLEKALDLLQAPVPLPGAVADFTEFLHGASIVLDRLAYRIKKGDETKESIEELLRDLCNGILEALK